VVRALARLPFLAVRRLRWWRGAWSKDSDRTYHERLYEAQDYDPFDPSYPGYVTIRRFADHAETLLPAAGTVLDLGCGPGEITCELARRHPGLSFLGVDHSAQAIGRATRHAERLGLTNIRFDVGDAEGLPAGERYGLVMMFDAFHHLERPRAFLTWLTARTTRCVLIEPAGTWSGRWARGLDVDWLLADLANIRERLEAVCGERSGAARSAAAETGADARTSGAPVAARPVAAAATAAASASAPLAQGEGAIERRYALDDFVRFFAGWHLRVTGTIAGVDRYPPGVHLQSALRPVAGELAYTLMRATESLLLERGRDGAAKHWVIAATTEAGIIEPRLPPTTDPIGPDAPTSQVASAYDVRYDRCDGPARVSAGTELRIEIDVVNAGWDTWRSDGDQPVHVSSHWLTPAGAMVEFDGLRSDLPRALGPGESGRTVVHVRAPAAAGSYLLAIDLVKEGVTWFSEAGSPWHATRIEVD
jgi:SAM-dependent methyltransferase